jgi:prephenate dehydrogenase
MRLAILGFGLIGGSVARALRARSKPGSWWIGAWSRTPAPLHQAVRDGVLDEAASSVETAVRGADLILLAAPPLTCLDLIDQLGGPLRGALGEDASVTDAASAKARIVARADGAGLHFIGGHPMAGREVSGYGAALPDLFVGRPWVTVPGRHARLVDGERIGQLIEGCGAVQVPMSARAHDEAVAAVSHLPLVVSAALVEAIAGAPGQPDRADWEAVRALAATGWAGMTRLARGEPAMGAGIAATNSAAIAARIRDLQSILDDWLVALEGSGEPDAEALRARFVAARQRLEEPGPERR